MKLATIFILAAATITITSCGDNTAGSNQIELQRVRSGDLDVVLLSDDRTLTHGKDAVTVEFRRGNSLVDVGTVKAGATMPMAGMAPMMGSVSLERGDTPGRYTASTDLSMSGGWNLKVDWDGPAGQGSASFAATVD
jgi:hypothetical protein